MVEGNHPEKAVIDFQAKSYANNKFQFVDSGMVSHNGIDWLVFRSTKKEFADPEERFQKHIQDIKKTNITPTEEEILEIRKHFKISTDLMNLSDATKYLSVVDYAKMSFAQNQNYYFKKGTLVYSVNSKHYFRVCDILNKESNQ